jgi:hypothetical protein
MALPYIILVLGYTLLASLFLWVGISLKGKWLIKFALAPVILWFGLFLYYVPPQLAGYPSNQELHEDKVIVRFFTYTAPTNTEEGEIFIVVDTRFYIDKEKKKTFGDMINPLTYTDISKNEYLRLYRLEWDEDLVKDMNKASKEKKLITLQKNRKQAQGEKGKDDKKKKKGQKGKPEAGEEQGEEDESGTGGTARNSKDKSKYSVEALAPNEVFKKSQ